MASEKIKMKAEKQYELERIASILRGEISGDCVAEITRQQGDMKVLMLVFEKYYIRNDSHASLVILLTEYDNIQTADIIGTGGKNTFFSYGAESNFALKGQRALTKAGFKWGN